MRSPEMSSSPMEATPKIAAKRKPVEASVETELASFRYETPLSLRRAELQSKIRSAQGELDAMGLGPEVYTVDNEDEFALGAIRSFIRQHGLKWVKKELMGDADDLEATYKSDDLGRAKVLHRWMRRDERDLEELSQDSRTYRDSPPDNIDLAVLKKTVEEFEASFGLSDEKSPE